MILDMYTAPGQGQINSNDNISKLIESFCSFDQFCETRGQKPFLYIDTCHNPVINYRNLPIDNPKRDIVRPNAYAKFE